MDITMCKNESCPIKDTCLRFTAKPSEFRQSYCNFQYRYNNKAIVECEYYINAKEYGTK